MSFFGIGQNAEVDIRLDPTVNQRQLLAKKSTSPQFQNCDTANDDISGDSSTSEIPLIYYDGENVSGKVVLSLKGSKLDHQGIKIELFGRIDLFHDRGNYTDFLTMNQDLARPGILSQPVVMYPFEFVNVQKPYETYLGNNAKLRYFLRVTVHRRLHDLVKERDLLVHSLSHYPTTDTPLKMEVGIEDCLHIEFQYNKTRYHLKDVILGKIYFLLVRVKIQYMELQLIRRECTGVPGAAENETIARFELMDGAPVRGECIPIRIFLQSYVPFLTPTMRDVYKKFSVRYCLNLVLVDEEDRRYFKQQEIILYRKSERQRQPIASQETVMALIQQVAGTTVTHHKPACYSSYTPAAPWPAGMSGEAATAAVAPVLAGRSGAPQMYQREADPDDEEDQLDTAEDQPPQEQNSTEEEDDTEQRDLNGDKSRRMTSRKLEPTAS